MFSAEWVGATGQWAAAAATVWAVLVALGSSKREREARKISVQMHHNSVKPDLQLVPLSLQPRGNPGFECEFHNVGNGIAKDVTLTLEADPSVVKNIRTLGRNAHFDVLRPGDREGMNWHWDTVSFVYNGKVSAEYTGLYGAKYRKVFEFQITVSRGAPVTVVADEVEYPGL